MSKSWQQFGLAIISGEDRSLVGQVVRAGMTVAEPVYATMMRLRNWSFDVGLKRGHDLGRPTISVGNITTGGTGKTPVVIWLANRLRDRGYRPAVLLRGYGSTQPGISDEQQLLHESLNAGSATPIPVVANPSRVDAAFAVLAKDPAVNVFILDDGFQHRRAKRDFDLVLVSATEAFGHGHVLPRGLLREPMVGLRRATAFLITRSSQAKDEAIEPLLAKWNPSAPIFRSDHVQSAVWIPSTGEHISVANLAGEKVFAFAGIGDPESFSRQLSSAGCEVVGRRWFADHHLFTAADVEGLVAAAKQAGARRLLTTRKDWVKIAGVISTKEEFAIGVVELAIEMSAGGEQALLNRIENCLAVPQAGRVNN
jgi:tetraacyldisaccharide 4'-kinase